MNVRLNKKHQRTLEAIFSTQVPATLQWRRIEALFMALGATKKEGRGSIVTFKLKDEDALFHRPHPQKEAKRYHVRKAREFLEQVGITP
ncbi:MAG: type II toxin-antitoxin system HicA family toxin [Candidatus Poribacteria bacterium]|nr:type II toxin-antitoxin system HicA family toxin [Candidatus Poribacteria bacterium]